MARWQLQDAKAKFSEVVKRAAAEGPQIVTYRGQAAAVVLSIEAYRRLEADKPSLVDWLLGGPKLSDKDARSLAKRPKDFGREVEF
jgi:prevent-host-death family protein